MLDLSNQNFVSQDWRGQDLRGVPMHHSTFLMCKFDEADMTDVDASHSTFTAGSMKRTKCTRTNFAYSHLNTIFAPSDAMGMTLTLSCNTFQGMTVSNIWWYAWIYFAFQMKPMDEPERLREAIVALIGKERFDKLHSKFKTRQL